MSIVYCRIQDYQCPQNYQDQHIISTIISTIQIARGKAASAHPATTKLEIEVVLVSLGEQLNYTHIYTHRGVAVQE